MRTTRSKTFALATVASLALLTAGCGSDDDAGNTSSDDMSSSAPAMDAGADLVGPGCADYAEANPSGAGSVDGMAQDPVATAASNNPLLTTLVQAVSGKLNSDVDLVSTLNGDQFTVFAPVDDAFAKLPADTVKALGTPEGAETLKTVLTYHVVPGQIAPADIDGTHKTVEGQELKVSGSGDSITVNEGTDAAAKVICGGVKTKNATVYLIDTVLMPPATK